MDINILSMERLMEMDALKEALFWLERGATNSDDSLKITPVLRGMSYLKYGQILSYTCVSSTVCSEYHAILIDKIK